MARVVLKLKQASTPVVFNLTLNKLKRWLVSAGLQPANMLLSPAGHLRSAI